MKKYVNPQLELVVLSTNDAITNSYGGENGDCYGYDFFEERIAI